MTSKLEIDSLRIRNSGSVPSASTPGSAGDLIWSGSYLYVCVDENTWKRVPIGSWSAPDQVTGLTADDVGDTTIDLSWNAPSSDDPITDYIIEYTTGQNTLTVFVGSNTTSYQLTNLVTDSEYSIRVAAISSAGTGTYSVTITETPGLFDPASITGLQLWLDASDASTLYDATTGGSLVAADGGVARWEDKSGNDYHMTQATAGARPLRKTSIQGGLDVLRFDGSDDFLSVPSSTATFKFLHETQASFFAVCKAGTTANPDTFMALVGTSDGIAVGAVFYYDDRTTSLSRNDRFRVTTGNNSTTVINAGTTSAAEDSLPANTYSVVSAVLDNTDATAANRVAMRLNGGTAITDNSSTSSASSSNAFGDLLLGAEPNDSFPNLDGDICEIIIYDSALSDTDREAVENYLLAKWGIT